jgi:Rieske Fe-S protein
MIDRRTVLKTITAIPILAVAGGIGAALLSYLKPTWAPLAFPTTEKPLNKDLMAATLEEFPKEFDSKQIVFTQTTVEYSARGKQATDILGFIVRIPAGKLDPATVGLVPGNSNLRRGFGETEYNGQKYAIVAVSRICAHLGCIFEYHVPADVCARFNYCGGSTPMFSCPCHLSVYDPEQSQDVNGALLAGRVVSGPAPRAPFPFDFELKGNQIIIKNYA